MALEEVDLSTEFPDTLECKRNIILSNCQSVINGLYFEQLW